MAPHDYNAPRRTNDSLIAQARMAKGLTQGQLADSLGISQQMIHKWESGKRIPTIRSLKRVARVLGVDWTTLVKEEGPQ